MITDFSDWHCRWPKSKVAKARAAVDSGEVQIIHADDREEVTYTVGLMKNHGSPELIFSSFVDDEATQRRMVKALVDRVRSKGCIPVGREFRLLEGRATLRAVSKVNARKVASLAYALYGAKLKLAQCVVADPNGLYPWSLAGLVDEDWVISQLPLYAVGPYPEEVWSAADRLFDRHAQRYKKVNMTGDVEPLPGHTRIFLAALRRAIAVAKKVGGLSHFCHMNYRGGELAISFGFRAAEVSEGIQDKVENIVEEAAVLSRSACVLCGGKAKPSIRMKYNGADLPFCDDHDANLAYGLLNFEQS